MDSRPQDNCVHQRSGFPPSSWGPSHPAVFLRRQLCFQGHQLMLDKSQLGEQPSPTCCYCNCFKDPPDILLSLARETVLALLSPFRIGNVDLPLGVFQRLVNRRSHPGIWVDPDWFISPSTNISWTLTVCRTLRNGSEKSSERKNNNHIKTAQRGVIKNSKLSTNVLRSYYVLGPKFMRFT